MRGIPFEAIPQSTSRHLQTATLRIMRDHNIDTSRRTPNVIRHESWDLGFEKLSKSLSKIMIAAEGVESKHSTSLNHQE